MRRYLLVLVALLLALVTSAQLSSSPALATNTGYVHSEGTSIVDNSGASFTLQAMNLGGILNWEGWLMGMQTNPVSNNQNLSESSIESQLMTLTNNSTTAANFPKQLALQGVTQADLHAIKNLKSGQYNAVRVPFNHVLIDGGATYDPNNPDGINYDFSTLDNVVTAAANEQMYVILDLHAAPGGQSTVFTADPDGGQAKLWSVANNKDATAALWKHLAAHFATNPWVAGYDLLNEPILPFGVPVTALTSLYQQIISAIRTVDTHHMVIIEGNTAATALPWTTRFDTTYTNEMWEFHQYSVSEKDRQGQIDGWLNLTQQVGVPLWDGEFGESSDSLVSSGVRMYSNNLNGLAGYAFWTWKKVNVKNAFGVLKYFPALEEVSLSNAPDWKTVLNYLDNGGTAPSSSVTLAGINEYLSAVPYLNTATPPQPNLIESSLVKKDVTGVPVNQDTPIGPLEAAANAADTTCSGTHDDGFESNPANAYHSDGALAINANGAGDCQQYYNYNIPVLTGKVIDGIQVSPLWRANSSAGNPFLTVQLSWDSGAHWTVAASTPFGTTTATPRSDAIGSEDGEFWTASPYNWTPTNLTSSTFRVRVQANCGTPASCTATQFQLDYLPLYIYAH
jgi:endoglucanase